jgi:hypothetical protein
MPQVIRIQRCDEVTGRPLNSGIPRCGHACICLTDQLYAAVFQGHLANYFRCTVRGTVVHDDYLDIFVRLGERRFQGFA